MIGRQAFPLKDLKVVPSFKGKLLDLGVYMGASKTDGTPKSFILIGFSIINHPFRNLVVISHHFSLAA